MIAYSSSKFKSAERNYSVHEKELLGVLHAVQQWNCFLEGSRFTVYTDHSSLIWLNQLKEPSRRQARWVDILQGHDFEVLYVKGAQNPADAFTRVPWQDQLKDDEDEPIREPLLVIRALRTALADAGLRINVSASKLKEWKESSEKLLKTSENLPPLHKSIIQAYFTDPNYNNPEWINKNELVFKDGIYYKSGRIAIPDIQAVKNTILMEQHDSILGGHLGMNKTIEKVSRLFWWSSMQKRYRIACKNLSGLSGI